MHTSSGCWNLRSTHTHECNDGNTDTKTSSARRTRSPPDTGINCSSGTPCAAITRMVS